MLALLTPPRVTFDLVEEASGAEVRPLLEVAVALERVTVEEVLPVWVVGVCAVPLLAERVVVVTLLEGVSAVVAALFSVERVVPVACLAAVLPVVPFPLLRRAAVPLEPLLVVVPVLPVPRFTWLPVVVPLEFPRFTWAPPEGAAVLVAVFSLRFAVVVVVL